MTDTPKPPTDCTCAGPDEHTPGCGVHHEQHVDVFQRLAACASTWMPSACVFGNVRADEIAAACEWAIDRATHRAAVVADSPELAQAFDLLGRARWELWRASRSAHTIEAIDAAFIAAGRDMPPPGPQEPVPAELAHARERIAALEAEAVESRERATMAVEYVVTQRDAALARAHELEAERAAANRPSAGKVEHARWAIAAHEQGDYHGRAEWIDEYREIIARHEAAAQPKPRDESVPPPGWESYSFRDGDGVLCDSMYLRRKPGNPLPVEAWRIYDAEHGYAPPDEAAIRADERRRTERDVVAHFTTKRGDTIDDLLADIAGGDYPRADATAPASASDRSHTERRLAALRAEKKARLRCDHGVELCEACGAILRDDAPRVACEDCTLCPKCADEISEPAAPAADPEGGAPPEATP